MDWEKWTEGKSDQEIVKKFEELVLELGTPSGADVWNMILEDAKTVGLDLYEETVGLKSEVGAILYSTALSKREKESKVKEVMERLMSVLQRVVEGAQARQRPTS